MDKERISAARKKLKEFQRHKKDQARKNESDHVTPDINTDSQKTSTSNSPETFHDNLQQCPDDKIDLKNNSEFNEIKMKSSDEFTYLSNNDYARNNETFLDPRNTNFSSAQLDLESINGATQSSLNSNFTPSHSRNESNSTVCSQIVYENVDHIQNLSTQKFQNVNSELTVSNNGLCSPQREHMLHMADILADQQELKESALNARDLEQKNKFLSCCLEEQKKIVNQFQIQVSQCSSKISELESIIMAKDRDLNSKLIREVHPLKEQIQLDAQTIRILVEEKAELTAANSQYQIALKQKTEENVELLEKLTNLQHKEEDRESELNVVKSNLEDLTKNYQKLQSNYEEAIGKSTMLKKKNEDFELEVSELQQKLNNKNTELSSLQQELQEKIALLSLSELRVQQLSNLPQEANSLETQHRTTKVLEQQLSQMKEALECVSGEKNEVNKKYQSYIQQLDERNSKLLEELEALKKVIANSDMREQSYIQRLSELEQQLQKNEEKPSPKLMEDQSEKINMLTKSIENLVWEQENFQSLLNEKNNEIELLRKELKELEEFKEQNVEASKLAVALQSEQLGASRAVSQNQQLKTQLDEMHDAFIVLSNAKLDLTEKLQAERTIGKKLNAKLNEIEQEFLELKDQLANKESLLQELKKEKLQTAQIEDQIQHYQAQSHSATTLQNELQKALITIESLKKENQFLETKLEAVESINRTKDDLLEDTKQASFNSASETNDLKKENICDNVSVEGVDSPIQSSTTNVDEIPNIPEAFKRLESRFKETMEKVAELTDEKQRLEHLVLQLQGETETIGEYVTLYQKQRAILLNKARERENTFSQLLEQRNQQQEQLHKLKVLVAGLLKSKNSKPTVTLATAAEENMTAYNLSDGVSDNIEVIEGHGNENSDDCNSETDQTTSQILDLLTEIKDCSNTCTLEPNFHPCPWCSGKLITV